MAYPFASKLFKGDRMLEACAESNSNCIWTGAPRAIRTGPHVQKIQMVLAKLGRNISNDERRTSTYGPTTAAAVLKFKTDRQIKRPCRPIDNIVGSRTIQALDDEAKKQKKQEDDALVDETTFWIDVVSQAWQTAID